MHICIPYFCIKSKYKKLHAEYANDDNDYFVWQFFGTYKLLLGA